MKRKVSFFVATALVAVMLTQIAFANTPTLVPIPPKPLEVSAPSVLTPVATTEQAVFGTVIETTPSWLTLLTLEGDEYRFSVGGISRKVISGVQPDAYVRVTYKGELSADDHTQMTVVGVKASCVDPEDKHNVITFVGTIINSAPKTVTFETATGRVLTLATQHADLTKVGNLKPGQVVAVDFTGEIHKTIVIDASVVKITPVVVEEAATVIEEATTTEEVNLAEELEVTVEELESLLQEAE